MLWARRPWRYAATITVGLTFSFLGLALGLNRAQAATPTAGDLVIQSITPSPTHVPTTGGDVTFTIVAQNNGTVAEQPAINLNAGQGVSTYISQDCPGATSVQGSVNSGWICDYPPLAPGATVTATVVAHIGPGYELQAFNEACVALADQVSPTNHSPVGDCQTANVTIDPNLTGVGPISADFEVDSITPSVDHAKPGDIVTFTTVVSNHGRDAGFLFVLPGIVTSDLVGFRASPLFESHAQCGAVNGPPPTPTYGGPSADGGACEYTPLIAPGDTVIVTHTDMVQGPGIAADTACAQIDPLAQSHEINTGSGWPCKTAAITVDNSASTTTTPSPPAGSIPPPTPAEGATNPSSSTPSPSPITTVRPVSRPSTSTCPTYTQRADRRSWQYTILTHQKVTCSQSRALIHRADHALQRSGVTVQVSSWSCRREPTRSRGVTWLDDCNQPRGPLLIWTERRGRMDAIEGRHFSDPRQVAFRPKANEANRFPTLDSNARSFACRRQHSSGWRPRGGHSRSAARDRHCRHSSDGTLGDDLDGNLRPPR